MKTLVEFLNDDGLDETNLSRLQEYMGNSSLGIISAFRDRYSLLVNRSRNRELVSDIKEAGFGYIELEGHTVEGDKEVKEESFLVFSSEGKADDGHLLGFMKKEGAKFNQESVLLKLFEGPKPFLLGTSSHDEDGNLIEFPGFGNKYYFDGWHPQEIRRYYSKMKGKTFVFESIRTPMGFFGNWARHLYEQDNERHNTRMIVSAWSKEDGSLTLVSGGRRYTYAGVPHHAFEEVEKFIKQKRFGEVWQLLKHYVV